eukprot:1953878-Pyramimonas_sp.AAC.2
MVFVVLRPRWLRARLRRAIQDVVGDLVAVVNSEHDPAGRHLVHVDLQAHKAQVVALLDAVGLQSVLHWSGQPLQPVEVEAHPAPGHWPQNDCPAGGQQGAGKHENLAPLCAPMPDAVEPRLGQQELPVP